MPFTSFCASRRKWFQGDLSFLRNSSEIDSCVTGLPINVLPIFLPCRFTHRRSSPVVDGLCQWKLRSTKEPSLGYISAFLSRRLLNDWNHETKSYGGFLRDALWSLQGISTINPTTLNRRSPKGLRREIGLINPLHQIFAGVLMCSIKSPLCQVRRQRPLKTTSWSPSPGSAQMIVTVWVDEGSKCAICWYFHHSLDLYTP